MFLKKKAHNLFSKSVKLALKGVKGSVTVIENKEKQSKSENSVIEESVKPKKPTKLKKEVVDELV